MVFCVLGTRVRLSFSFVAIIALMVAFCDESIVLCSLVASLIHETGHLFFMCIFGDTPVCIEFSAFGIRITRGVCVRLSYSKEIIISLGGIIFNLLTALTTAVIHCNFGIPFLLMASVVNTVVAMVNLFPVRILDCGKAVRYALLLFFGERDKCERYADIISVFFVVVFSLISIIYISFNEINISLIAVNLYLIFITIIKKWS